MKLDKLFVVLYCDEVVDNEVFKSEADCQKYLILKKLNIDDYKIKNLKQYISNSSAASYQNSIYSGQVGY